MFVTYLDTARYEHHHTFGGPYFSSLQVHMSHHLILGRVMSCL